MNSQSGGESALKGLPLPIIVANGSHNPLLSMDLKGLTTLPGLRAWSLDCRRKTLRGVLRGWLLNSRKAIR